MCLLCSILSCVRRFLCFWVSKIGGVLSGAYCYCSTVEGRKTIYVLVLSGKISLELRTVQQWRHIGLVSGS